MGKRLQNRPVILEEWVQRRLNTPRLHARRATVWRTNGREGPERGCDRDLSSVLRGASAQLGALAAFAEHGSPKGAKEQKHNSRAQDPNDSQALDLQELAEGGVHARTIVLPAKCVHW